jgi:hypothetical protein
MDEGDAFCRNVVTIPQYESTCWFNSILMSLLYSQNSRKLLLAEHKNFDKRNRLLSIVNKILLSNYMDKDKAQKYFNIIRPEVILAYVKDLNEPTLQTMILRGWFSNVFLYKFIEQLGRTCIVLDYYNKKFYAGITQSMNIQIIRDYDTYRKNIYFTHTREQIKEKIQKIPNPDYIYINIWKSQDKKDDTFAPVMERYEAHAKAPLLLNSYGFSYDGLETFNKIITFNGYEYILDSCINTNYNQISNIGHDIAGITCKNNKYIYNGWLRKTNDAALRRDDSKYRDNDMPCDLIKYDWDVNNDNKKICIDSHYCKMKKVRDRITEQSRLCFSFGIRKGRNTLIYVRLKPLEKDKVYLSKDKNATISPTSISSQLSLNSLLSREGSPISPLKDDEIFKGYPEGHDEYESLNSEEIAQINYDRYNLKRMDIKDEKRRKRQQEKREAIRIKKDLRTVAHKP